MRNKGAIQLVAILFAVFSLFHLSFSWVTSKVEKDAKEYAKGDATKELAYLDSISNEPVYNFLWIKKFKYKECTDREMNFGLDLKGGMNVMLEVSVADLVNALANNNPDPTFQKALHKAMDNEKTTDVDFISLFEKEFLAADPNAKLAGIFSTPKLKDKVSYQSTNDEVISVLREEAAVAFDNSFKILRTRIDRFGVTQPNIQRQGLENSSRILVELPGVKDRERVRKLLQGSANLEFWETFDNAEIFSLLMEANTSIAKFNEASTSPANVAANDSTAVLTDSTAASASADTALSKSLVQQLKVDSVDNGLDKFRSSNPLFAALNPSVSQEGKPYEGATVGTANKKDTALVMKYLNRPEIRMIFPRELNFAWEVKSIVDEKQRETGFFRLIALKGSKQKGGPVLEGDVVTDAREQIDPVSSQVEVSMSMNGAGAADWARITRENTGHQVAIVLDGYVYSAPRVNGEIKGGNSSISGSFTLTEAKDLANILQSGKLPAPARILQQEIVGPTLGAESISAGLLSFVIAFLVVLAYMVFYYNKAGWVANFALIVNVFFIFGVLASLNAVLTLPGIAGIVLTIGMAVDANVLIFERIREELAAGKSLSSAIADGFSNALSAIVDANVTTLITAIILYMFGSGPVQGFATTLGIGILTSLFAAIFISRLVIDSMLKRKKEITFSTKFSERAFKNVNFKFMQFRKTGYYISGTIILIGIISMLFRGFSTGVDFQGGRTYVIRYEKAINTEKLSASLYNEFGVNSEVKTFGDDNQVKITTKYRSAESGDAVDHEIETKLYEGSKDEIASDVTFTQFTENNIQQSLIVGPTIANDIKRDAVLAILLSILAIFGYILLRFEGRHFGFGAIASLVHDVLILLTIYSLFYSIAPFSMEIDQSFIAAVLTVIGYSVNDTVIIFDRLREYLAEHKKGDRLETYNRALNSTLSRTFSTTFSTIIVLIAIFIFGGASLRGFVFALLIGIVVGTYSSLFVATPLAYDTLPKELRDKDKEERTNTK